MQTVTRDASADKRLVGLRSLRTWKQKAHRRARRSNRLACQDAMRSGDYEAPRRIAYLTGWEVA